MAVNYPYVSEDGTLGRSGTLTRSTHTQVVADSPGTVMKEHMLYIWNPEYERWHECLATLKQKVLWITEYEDLRMEVNEKQLLHLKADWYHGDLTRREAKCILMDYDGGNGSFLVRASESYHGKFAISFVHESRVKHVVVESKRDPVAGIMYNITPNGPYFTSLYEVIEEARKSPIIQNHMFDIVLTSSPPKVDMRWMCRYAKSVSQIHDMLARDHRDGAFLLYRAHSEDVPYRLSYRSGKDICHENIVATQRPNPGYMLNSVAAPVLYKLIHYFMENPIRDETVLKYPIGEVESQYSNNACAIHDYDGRHENGLSFTIGSLITSVRPKTKDWYTGDFRGERGKWLPADKVRLLERDEWAYVSELKMEQEDESQRVICDVYSLSLSHNAVSVEEDEEGDITSFTITPLQPVFKGARTYKLGAPTEACLKDWCQALQDVGHVCRAYSGGSNSRQCTIS